MDNPIKGILSMLVLVRKPTESILVGDDITITVVSTTGGQVKIGIDAPREIVILREELVSTPSKPD